MKRDAQSLKDPKWSQTKIRSQHREESIEERHRPRYFGKKKEDDLEDDEEAVDDGPEHTGGLIWHGTVPIVFP